MPAARAAWTPGWLSSTTTQPVHDLVPGQRPPQLGSEGDVDACGDALAVDQHAIAVEYDDFNGLDHPRSIGLAVHAPRTVVGQPSVSIRAVT